MGQLHHPDPGDYPVTLMSNVRESLAAIEALPLPRTVRILNLCGDQERIISVSEMRRALPRQVELVSGPGCAASICPEADIHQAICLSERQPVTVLVADNLLRLPLSRGNGGRRSLSDAQRLGADVRVASAPIHAVMMARAEPDREMVYFVAGFETLLAPLAGMVLEGLPDNLSILLCGRRVEPLVEQELLDETGDIDALLLPGNRCAVTGTRQWEKLSADFRRPAVVAGYTSPNILSAIHMVLQQHCNGEVRVDNLYRGLVRPEGNALARDQLDRVFELVAGDWRGLGAVQGTAFRMRRTYDVFNADRRFPDYRSELLPDAGGMPDGCECAAVALGRKPPLACPLFLVRCTPQQPYGPCMASDDGACYLQRTA